MIPDIVDLVVLSRDAGPLHPDVQAGIDQQQGVHLDVHRVLGPARPEDVSRWDAIVRARNEGKRMGRAGWLMFLDDDVVLAAGSVQTLLAQLMRRPAYAALAADYLGERIWPGPAPHVSMGATLFRRSALDQIQFRWERNKCECRCCGDDLRRRFWAIDYLAEASARHLRPEEREDFQRHTGADAAAASTAPDHADATPAHVLAAFDRRHYHAFREQFLASLRRAGNSEAVTAVAFGLYPSERRRLERQPNLHVIACHAAGENVAQRRLQAFQSVVGRLAPGTPVAYWDAGDVVFQDSLQPLWKLVSENPDKLLAVREPTSHPENRYVKFWTETIHDPEARDRAIELLAQRPFLNAGFAAGTARAMLCYLQTADDLLHSSELAGTADWGDQTAMNLYCHSNPHAWHEIPEAWNFCLLNRHSGEVLLSADGRVESATATPIHVVHGNGGTLPRVLPSYAWRIHSPRGARASTIAWS